MPLHDVFRRVRTLLTGSPPVGESADAAVVSAADHDALRALLAETRQRLAVADRRVAILEGSNRTAVRAVRTFVQEREHLVAEREAAEVRLSIAVGDRQRTMMLNDRLLAALRESEEARERLANEIRRRRSEADEDGRSDARSMRAAGSAGPTEA